MKARTRFVQGLAVVTAGIFLTGIGIMHSASAAVRPLSSGGGCSDDPSPWPEACISASGIHVEPDAYLHAQAGCESITFYVNDLTQGGTFGYSLPCGVNAHEGPFPLRGTQGHVYQSEIVEQFATYDEEEWSKPLTFSD